jgi:hypothetical protein
MACAFLVALATLDPAVGCDSRARLEAASAARVLVNLDLKPGLLSVGTVAAARREAAALWRSAGIDLHTPGLNPAQTLRVVLLTSTRVPTRSPSTVPLGALQFVDGHPERQITVFYDAVKWIAVGSWRPFWALRPPAGEDGLVGRVLGRVIAHEVGHYLSASTTHAARGLMQAEHSAAEFRGESRAPFRIEQAERFAPPTPQ